MRWGTAAGALALGLTVPVVGPLGPASAEPALCLNAFQDGQPVTSDEGSPLVEQLGLAQVRDELGVDGTGVKVAVVDSGVGARVPVDLVGEQAFGGASRGTPVDPHGSEVAGIIAGAPVGGVADRGVGVAPGAQIVSLKVLDIDAQGEQAVAQAREQGLTTLTPQAVAQALDWVAAQVRGGNDIGVVNVSLGVDPGVAGTDVLRPRLEALAALDVLVVAAAPNVPPTQEGEENGLTPLGDPPTEDPADVVAYPAGYSPVLPNVLSVGSMPFRGAEPSDGTRPSYFTDVVAPSQGAVTYLPDGSSCALEFASSYSTAVVSGVAALLRQRNPDWTAAEVATRLEETAGGVTDAPNAYGGAGVVQPYDALTRTLQVDPETGRVTRSASAPRPATQAEAPTPQEDLLDDSRQDFLWWGLVAGAAVVLALVLRPATSRLRRR
ncbi:S8 family serine peptidase [Nocardioides sp. ChNu-153]|uniref:S8 family serine peptidase n=1 Tax=unclassified Nocardioides TaxID=2615069 RepID=UPI002404BF28|nr:MULTISPECIES: S8 family serine peptidase [unclassified Nocardioides]MDF9718061.1 S8 family serine peptidase [Nocardioides sp. ChNu-99]MDN7122389.1 S8 family serine peptidase [Nocardioides sp. ChNu-153]